MVMTHGLFIIFKPKQLLSSFAKAAKLYDVTDGSLHFFVIEYLVNDVVS